jgi:hypothetical protein
MEKTQILPSFRKGENLKDKKKLNNIIKEYSLIRNQFNPSVKSPNIFMNKLELRMKTYYYNLLH